MSKVSDVKVKLAQAAVEKVGLGKLEVSPYPCKLTRIAAANSKQSVDSARSLTRIQGVRPLRPWM